LPNSATAGPPWTSGRAYELAIARERFKKVRRGIIVAWFDAWSIAVFAVLTLVFAIPMLSFSGTLVGIGLALVAIIEFRAAAKLNRLDPHAPRRLALNQIFLSLVLLTYAAYAFMSAWHNIDPYVRAVEPTLLADPNVATGVSNGDFTVEQLVRLTVALVYGALALVALIVQPATALFYLSRRKHLKRYLGETPQWIVEMQQAGGKV
jgi:hypothetical protein